MWHGFYVGINAGAVLGDVKVSEPASTFGWEHDGMAIGGHAGYNFQFDHIVAGIEGDVSWSNAKGSATIMPGMTVKTETEYLASIRARLGYAFDSVLFYGTVGYGIGSLKATMTGSEGNSDRFDGIAYGVGMDVKLTQSLSGRIESIHYGFRKTENDAGLTIKSEIPQTVIRGGLTFHLN